MFLTTTEAAAELGISVGRVRQLVLQGRLPHFKLGARALAIHPEDLDLVRERRVGRPPAPPNTVPSQSGPPSLEAMWQAKRLQPARFDYPGHSVSSVARRAVLARPDSPPPYVSAACRRHRRPCDRQVPILRQQQIQVVPCECACHG